MITAHRGVSVERTIAKGALGVLHKPFESHELYSILESLTGQG